MGIFRKRWEFFYTPKRKIPAAPHSGVTVPIVSRLHPSKNLILRDMTFRIVLWQYYRLRRPFYSSIFVPGITNAVQLVHPSRNPRLRDSTFRPPFLDYYQPRRVLPPAQFVPGITNIPGLNHPSRNPRLRDRTFRPPWLEHYQPTRVLYPSQFVPGVINFPPLVHPSKNPRLRDATFRPPHLHYYQPKRRIYPAVFVPGELPKVSKIHPSRNPLLRDGTFRPPEHRTLRHRIPPSTTAAPANQSVPLSHKRQLRVDETWWNYYKKQHKFYASQFVPGILNAPSINHPSRNLRLRNSTFRPPFLNHYQPKRVLYPSQFVPGITNEPPLVHPSRNPRLRDGTFRPPYLNYYQPKRRIYPSQFIPGITNAIPIVHPERNPRLRDKTFRPDWLEYYQPKRVLPPSQFVPGFTPGTSKVHPSRNLRLRDNTFRESGQRPLRHKLPPSQAAVVAQSVTLSRRKRFLETRSEWWQYYKRKRTLPPSVVFVPGWLPILPKVHPSRNYTLRDSTFRPPWDYHQPDRTFLNVPPFVPPTPTPSTARGSRWHQKTRAQIARDSKKGKPMPKWFYFRDEIERLDEETLLELDDL